MKNILSHHMGETQQGARSHKANDMTMKDTLLDGQHLIVLD